MRAAVYERYGPPEVVTIREVPKPVPRRDEILVRVRATTVTSGDWRLRSLEVPRGFKLLTRLAFGISGPRQPILGMELAGDVEAAGEGVTQFAVGDAVFAFSSSGLGCHAEYKCLRVPGLVEHKPPNLSYGEAAALSFGGTTTLDFFRRGRLRRGESVLVVGASGGVGTAAVQLARHFGARVTGVCSAANVELVRALGAERVIDYGHEDFATAGETYDVVLDATGSAPFSRSRAVLRAGGRFLMVLGGLPDLLRVPFSNLASGKRIVAGPAAGRAEDVRVLGQLARVGALRPVVDRNYRFEQIVAAHRHVDTGRKKGNVVVMLADDLA